MTSKGAGLDRRFRHSEVEDRGICPGGGVEDFSLAPKTTTETHFLDSNVSRGDWQEIALSRPLSESVVLIPAFDPGPGLVPLVQEIRQLGLDVLVVDDGSAPEYAFVFAELEDAGVPVARHAENRGKGAALKTGIRLLAEWGAACVVTADADGQHLPSDIAAVERAVREHPDDLVLGVRNLSEMPGRSRAGNKITRVVTRIVCNLDLTDTQTGLRGFSLADGAADRLCQLDGDGYEFEMSMLVHARELFGQVVEVPIRTVYEPHNPTTHFDTVRDSFRVYRVLLGMLPAFVFVSLSSFVVDYLLFALFSLGAGLSAVVSTVAARVISATFNYTFNRLAAFRVRGTEYTPLRYFALAAFILVVNSALMWLFSDTLGLPGLAVKVPVELLCYLVSFSVQSNLAARDTPR